MSEHRLVLPAKLEDFTGGFAAGSVEAHYLAMKKVEKTTGKKGKVFWYCALQFKGLGAHHDYFEQNWEYLRKHPGEKSDEHAWLSEVGYFYVSELITPIAWQFKLEGIYKSSELENEPYLKQYVPSFREAYLQGEGYWFLFSSLKQIKHPLQFMGTGSSFRVYQTDTLREIIPISGHIRNNCFVVKYPEVGVDLEEPSVEKVIEQDLLQLLTSGGKDSMKEAHAQAAFFLALLEKGANFAREGEVEIDQDSKEKRRGRFDFLVKKGAQYFAFEFKLIDDSDAPRQLEEYITALTKNRGIDKSSIQGIIVCGKPSSETEHEAEKRGYKVWSYRVNLEFDWINRVVDIH
jgi:hypothetical protein